jgi:hypothetical protein
MNNLSHKVAIASACTALSFVLGASEEVKAATIILRPTTSFGVIDYNVSGQGPDGVGDSYYSGVPLHVGSGSISLSGQWGPEERLFSTEDRAFYEFNIANLSLAPNTVISSAIFQVRVDSLTAVHRYYGMQLFGYKGNGRPDTSDFSNGAIGGPFGINKYPLSDFSIYLDYFMTWGPEKSSNFDTSFSVTPFINELISKNNAFAGFSFRDNGYYMGEATLNNMDASLIITTTEPVPEPTTIFGSAIALGLGGWLKRKKLSRQNRTTPHH